jgi:hypothetical protein
MVKVEVTHFTFSSYSTLSVHHSLHYTLYIHLSLPFIAEYLVFILGWCIESDHHLLYSTFGIRLSQRGPEHNTPYDQAVPRIVSRSTSQAAQDGRFSRPPNCNHRKGSYRIVSLVPNFRPWASIDGIRYRPDANERRYDRQLR